MNPVSLLIFDLDGTLIDSRKDIADSVNLTFRDLGLPEISPQVIYGYVGNGIRRLLLDTVKSADPDWADRALEIFEGHYLKHLLDETELYPGMEETLQHFRHKKKAVVTNKPLLYTTKIMDGLNVRSHFDIILGAEPIVNLKPHPEMIFRALEYLDITPDEAVMIGDTLNDLTAARAAGVKSCAVGYGLGNVEELISASPDFFAETVSDLKRIFR
ncbi:MAG TPA: HAD-IA family hydrolase [Candidatus Manganitrophaceae bacterium]|nr:HAD-IA family hydrolase [Candidatus Manganitrophaceae bacterium]